MTKKHFQRMAELVRAIRDAAWTDDLPEWAVSDRSNVEYVRAVQTAEAFIVLALEFNPRFDQQRFLKACGLLL